MNEKVSRLIYARLLEKINVEKIKALTEKERLAKLKEAVKGIIENEEIIIGPKDAEEIAQAIYLDSFGFGPITALLRDEEISEVLVNDYDEIYIEKNGKLKRTDIRFRDPAHIKNIIDKVLSPLGLRVDESSPMVDARLQDGSRINVVIRPISFCPIVISIRKFKKKFADMVCLINSGMLSQKMKDFLHACVLARLNIIVSGGTSTGKTTFLNVLSNMIPSHERVISIEDTLELSLQIRHCVKLESRPPNIEGRGEIAIRDLVKNALRMRPDRIIVGEIRGTEAVDVLSAMNTGHAGSMTTVHANSPNDMVSRIETMLLMSGINLNPASAQRIIASSIDLVIHLERLKDGRRVVSAISELSSIHGLGKKQPSMSIDDIYCLDPSQKEGFFFTGHIPAFVKKLDPKKWTPKR